ncbi:OLC1v1011962C2 [Oldenlandia corymbosa var. corymbosa]|uniref:OLC1v1011962C2 n=1 Tax=Oldenlandia corymbosa var. corymbosa TaxID=529605 RepID=A0AAV1DWP0_OLDCO|nr:OLC1v1011962C2 [Oldenlandia corymbosa var. corymbosa]
MGTMVQSGAGFLLNCPLSFTPSPSSSSLSPSPWSWKAGGGLPLVSASSSKQKKKAKGFQVGAFFFDPAKDPIIKDALKEPVAFMGGMFAGLLRLDLNEDPLREWITRTAEAAGITKEQVETDGDGGGDIQSEESPQPIEIE